MDINLDYQAISADVRRSLSIIGKRSVDENGNLLFKDITLSSLEEPLLEDYLHQAAIDITVETGALITEATQAGVKLIFPENVNTAPLMLTERACKAYCVSYTLASWFAVTAPRLVAKYTKDCTRQMAAIQQKRPPATPMDGQEEVSPLAPRTTVTTNP